MLLVDVCPPDIMSCLQSLILMCYKTGEQIAIYSLLIILMMYILRVYRQPVDGSSDIPSSPSPRRSASGRRGADIQSGTEEDYSNYSYTSSVR